MFAIVTTCRTLPSGAMHCPSPFSPGGFLLGVLTLVAIAVVAKVLTALARRSRRRLDLDPDLDREPSEPTP